MSKRLSRISFFILAWAALAALASSARAYEVFPSSAVFQPVLADPREVQLGLSYYRLRGDNDADVALGHSWGMTRWTSGGGLWLWQWDIEGVSYARFHLSGGINKFEAEDFFANVPLEVRRGPFSGKFYLYHESAHLGDDYIRDTGNTGFRYSVEGVKGLLAADAGRFLRVYGGGGYLFHSIPTPQRGTLQAGLEITGPTMRWTSEASLRPYLAEDVESHANVGWNVNSNSVLGVKIASKDSGRDLRVYVAYFVGHSPYGQFYFLPEHYASIGLGFDL